MLQVKFLLIGLLLAAGFVLFQWLQSQPGIPPVRLPSEIEAKSESDSGASSELEEPEIFRLEEDLDSAIETRPEGNLPALNASDDWLRERFADTALPWLDETELVRTSATVLHNAANGKVPRKFVEFLAPEGGFTATSGNKPTPTAASFARYDRFVSLLTSVPPERAASSFKLIEPLLSEALRELGGDANGNVASPRELVYAALDFALATPRGIEGAALVQPKVIYKYADAELEDLLPLQKQLLRMGPANVDQVQSWLEDFGTALVPGLSDASWVVPAETESL